MTHHTSRGSPGHLHHLTPHLLNKLPQMSGLRLNIHLMKRLHFYTRCIPQLSKPCPKAQEVTLTPSLEIAPANDDEHGTHPFRHTAATSIVDDARKTSSLSRCACISEIAAV